jgi:Fe-S cluster assembly ATP-binding protein
MSAPLLEIENLMVSVGGKPILRGVSLVVPAGEVHAVMGPNGSGKSTLANVLAGREEYEVTGGAVRFRGQDLLALSPEERAREGVFLAFQYPVEIPGVSNSYFMKASLNAVRTKRGQPELDAIDFLQLVKQKMKDLDEILQMSLLEPALAVLDETDSGLDIDALRIVADGVNRLRSPERAVLAITHYQRLLDYLVPDKTHVLMGGRIVKSGDRSLAVELEKRGYGWIEHEVAGAPAA